MLQTVKCDIIAFVFCGVDLLLLSGRWLQRRVRRSIAITDKPERYMSKATQVVSVIWQEELSSHVFHKALD
jgi:membrane protein implicated in regulation of membrane protease activity